MSYNKLLKEGRIEQHKATKQEIRDILALADRDLKLAHLNIAHDWDWGFSIAYNAVLQACRALMYSKGYRALGVESHKTTFRFLKEALGKKYETIIGYFDRMRIKRNRAIYNMAGLITETEVKEMLKNTEFFIKKIKDMLNLR